MESYPSQGVIVYPRPDNPQEQIQMLYEVKIIKALGGRNDRTQFSNSHFLLSSDAIDATALRDDMDYLVAGEQIIESTAVQFMRTHLNYYAHQTIQLPDHRFVTKELDVQGLRAPADNTDSLMPLDLTVEVKRDTVTGRAGRMFMRGCLYASDGAKGADGGFALGPAGAFATGPGAAFITHLNGALPSGATLMLPEKANLIYQPARLIAEHRLGGLVVVKRTRRRISPDSAVKNAAERKFRDLMRQAKKLAPSGIFSALTGGAAAVLNALQAEAAPLITELGPEFIGYALPFAEGAILLA